MPLILEKYREEGRKEGLDEGIKIERLRIARELLKLGAPIEMIAKATGLSHKEIEALR